MLANEYTQFYLARETAPMFPNEAIVRIFRGVYPNLDMKSLGYAGKRLVDVGCGDGMNFLALADLGLQLSGTEISDEICRSTMRKLGRLGIVADIRQGTNDNLPFSDGAVDILLSWNSSYYMGMADEYRDFHIHAAEFSRVTASTGRLVMSVPAPGNFIFAGAEEVKPGYRVIRNDPYSIRNGQVMRCFRDHGELQAEFDDAFEDFRFGYIQNDFFGQANCWILMVAGRKQCFPSRPRQTPMSPNTPQPDDSPSP